MAIRILDTKNKELFIGFIKEMNGLKDCEVKEIIENVNVKNATFLFKKTYGLMYIEAISYNNPLVDDKFSVTIKDRENTMIAKFDTGWDKAHVDYGLNNGRIRLNHSITKVYNADRTSMESFFGKRTKSWSNYKSLGL